MNDIFEVPVDLIDDPQMAMRENVRDEDIDTLMQSIKQVGLLEPLVVRAVVQHLDICEGYTFHNGVCLNCKQVVRYEVIAGHRRLTALRLLNYPLVQVKVLPLDDTEVLVVRMHENAHRQNVNPVDEAVYIGEVMAKLGFSVEEMAQRLNRSPGYVYDRLAILEFPDYMIAAVGDKKISISAAIALNKIQDEATKRNFVEYASKDGITLERANAWVAMVAVGGISETTTAEQLKALEAPEQNSSVYIDCMKCKVQGKIGDMVTVWIHKECPADPPADV